MRIRERERGRIKKHGEEEGKDILEIGRRLQGDRELLALHT